LAAGAVLDEVENGGWRGAVMPTSGDSGRQDAGEQFAASASGVEGARHPADPDYRFTLANERTFLAWFRTSLALIAGGVAVVQLVPEFAFPGARHALGVLLTIGGGVLSVAALRRWQQVQEAMRREEDLPPTRIPAVLGIAMAVLTVFVVVLLVLSMGRS
jgi:putative membrane protein